MTKQHTDLLLTERFTQAVDYARTVHTEFRKGTHIPYIAHLIGVASLVLSEADGKVPITEDMVIAALLHDTAEDHGGQGRLDDVEKKFGPNVARMVAGLSDTLAADHDKKEGWEQRKETYLSRLHHEPLDVLVISVADKLYNSKAILDDLRDPKVGAEVWKRFKRGPEKQLWYFDCLLKIFQKRLDNRLVRDFARVVAEIKAWPNEATS
jgi:(p)ppGpp synthase/HD superfamily hydrolase